MIWEVRLTVVELAAFACSHDLCGVGDRGWPVETLSERVAHEGAWRHMMATDSGVDVSKRLPTLGDRDASLQDPRGAALVDLSVNHDEGLGSPGNTSRLCAIRG